MLVKDRMTHPVITVHPDMPMQEAFELMRKEKVGRFPVVNSRGKLVGIVSEDDLLNASPSDVTTLSVFEMSYLLSKITVERIMTKNVITVNEDTPIEEAARVLADNRIGGLPVMRGDQLVGIVTETDLFNVFFELLGARQPGVRLTVVCTNEPGALSKLTSTICNIGGNVVSLATFLGDTPEVGSIVMKVSNVSLENVQKAIEPIVVKIVDLRETGVA